MCDYMIQGVTALAVTSKSRQVVSGGGEGQVRVWDIFKQYQEMRSALKEHKGNEQLMNRPSPLKTFLPQELLAVLRYDEMIRK